MSLRTRNFCLRFSSALVVVLASTLTLGAAEKAASASTPPSQLGVPLPIATTPDFGTDEFEVVTLSSYDFHEFRQAGAVTGVDDDGNGFLWATGGNNKLFIGSFHLPAGAVIDSFGLRYCDTTANSNFDATLWDLAANGNAFGVANASFPGTACTLMYSPAGLNYLWSGNSGHSLDLYLFQTGNDVGGEVKFRGAEIRFKRSVSLPPLTATFLDVPSSDFGYQYIEALADSGITGGCGGGNFCPDASVTRRQMAIFLAKALGLHFPN